MWKLVPLRIVGWVEGNNKNTSSAFIYDSLNALFFWKAYKLVLTIFVYFNFINITYKCFEPKLELLVKKQETQMEEKRSKFSAYALGGKNPTFNHSA